MSATKSSDYNAELFNATDPSWANTTKAYVQEEAPNKVYKSDSPFEQQLKHLLNCHSKENESNTPDNVLRDYIIDSLAAFDKAVNARWVAQGADAQGWELKHRVEQLEGAVFTTDGLAKAMVKSDGDAKVTVSVAKEHIALEEVDVKEYCNRVDCTYAVKFAIWNGEGERTVSCTHHVGEMLFDPASKN